MILRLLILLFLPLLFHQGEANTLDPYKVLGVDRSANQREIQKAFHKLSLKYHPDKNTNKGAQEKFAEINNAYEILSDEDKRKNYDLYGDEKGSPDFDPRNFESHEGYRGNFGSHDRYTSGQGNTKTFSYSFTSGPGNSGNPSGFGFGDMFSNLFSGSMKGGSQFGGFSGSGGPNSGYSKTNIVDVNLQIFNKKIRDQGLTWLLLFYTPSVKGYHVFKSILENVSISLSGALKAGKINCLSEHALCKDLGVSTSRSARLFIYSYRTDDKGSLLEYSGDFNARSLKSFCQEHLPMFSKRVELRSFEFSASAAGNLPHVLLLSTKKDTPVMWRALSGLYRRQFIFYDAEVHDVSHPMLKRLGVDVLPALVGRLVDGKEHVLRTGITVPDLKSGINELSTLLEAFVKKNKKAASSQAKKPTQPESQGKSVPYLTGSNMDSLCSDKTTVCIIGSFRSSKAMKGLEAILSAISQKTLVRRHNQLDSSTDLVSYCLLDASKHPAFLYAFDKSGYKSSDKLLVAYKPRRGKFAVYTGEVTMEEAESFVSSVLSGDARLTKIRQEPVVR